MSDIQETSDVRSYEEWANKHHSTKGSGMHGNQSFFADDITAAAEMENRRKQREEQLELRGRNIARNMYENTMASKDKCHLCHSYGIYEELPFLNNLLDFALELKFPEFEGEGFSHIRRHLVAYHPKETASAISLRDRYYEYASSRDYVYELSRNRNHLSDTKENEAKRSELYFKIKEQLDKCLQIYRSDKELAAVIDREAAKRMREEQKRQEEERKAEEWRRKEHEKYKRHGWL